MRVEAQQPTVEPGASHVANSSATHCATSPTQDATSAGPKVSSDDALSALTDSFTYPNSAAEEQSGIDPYETYEETKRMSRELGLGNAFDDSEAGAPGRRSPSNEDTQSGNSGSLTVAGEAGSF